MDMFFVSRCEAVFEGETWSSEPRRFRARLSPGGLKRQDSRFQVSPPRPQRNCIDMFGVHMFFRIQGQNSKCSRGGVLTQLSLLAWPGISSVVLELKLQRFARASC